MSRANRDRARDIYADGLLAQGKAWATTATSVRAGYTNIWIEAGIDAVLAALTGLPDAEDDSPEETGWAKAVNRA